MEKLKLMEAEFEEIINDIQQYPEHRNDYDLVGFMKEIEKRCFVVSKQSMYILDNKNIEEIESQAIVHMSKIDKKELLTLKTLLVTIFDVAISNK